MGWQDELIPADMTIEDKGQQVPFREVPFVKEAKDFPTFLKTAYDAHREVGARVRLPGKDAKPEEVSAFKAKLAEGGFLQLPPESPDKYEINREGADNWDEALEGWFRTVAHQNSLSNAQANALVKGWNEQVKGLTGKQGESYEAEVAKYQEALKKEWAHAYDDKLSAAARHAANLVQVPADYLEGLEDNEKPLAPLAYLLEGISPAKQGLVTKLIHEVALANSNGSTPARGSETGSGGTIEAEIRDIRNNKDNPRHKLYWDNDPATVKYVEELAAKLHPGEVQI